MPKSYIKSTKEGKLYISNQDFFKRDKVQSMITQLMDTSVYKNTDNAV